MFRVEFAKSAHRELLDLPMPIRKRVFPKIQSLADAPRPFGSVKLKNTNRHRIRIGPYRVVYLVDDARKEVVILSIGHRREVYRR